MDEAIKNLGAAAIAGRVLAAEEFMQQQRPNPPFESLLSLTSSTKTITAIADRIKEWREKQPENKHLVVTMLTSDGRLMDVQSLRPEGYNAFSAQGYVKDMPCMIVAHIATLRLFCAFEETKGKARVGFIAELPEHTTEPQPTPEQK